jgi:hypothetical protein
MAGRRYSRPYRKSKQPGDLSERAQREKEAHLQHAADQDYLALYRARGGLALWDT